MGDTGNNSLNRHRRSLFPPPDSIPRNIQVATRAILRSINLLTSVRNHTFAMLLWLLNWYTDRLNRGGDSVASKKTLAGKWGVSGQAEFSKASSKPYTTRG